MNLSKENRRKISILVGVLLVGLIATIVFRVEDFLAFIEENRSLTLILSLLIYIVLGFTFIPSSPITLFLAVLIGPLLAALVATVGNSIAAVLEYKVGETVGDVLHFEERKQDLPFNLGELPITSPYLLTIGRILPGGVRGLSYVAGAYHVPMKLYLLTTIGMNVLSAFFIAFGGEQLLQLI